MAAADAVIERAGAAGRSDSAAPLFLDLKNVSKRFGGVRAVDAVDFDLAVGEVHCLVGENGCGKSTLIKIISGVLRPEFGAEMTIAGRPAGHLSPTDSVHRGIQVIYQDLSLFPNLTVAENIGIGHHVDRIGPVHWRAIRAGARAAMARIGVSLDLDAKVGSLSIANRQLVAICRALAADARLVIMDEPTASLTRHEVDALLRLVLDLKAKGIATMFVSHRLDEVMEIADRVTVMRDGRKVGTYPAAEISAKRLAFLMTGKEFHYDVLDRRATRAEPVLEVQGLAKAGEFADIGFTLHRGEILGLTGLLGSGRTEMALALFGMNPPDAGTIRIDGKAAQIRSNREAIEHGIAYVSEDRLTLGLVLPQSIARNATVTIFDKLASGLGLIRRRLQRQRVADAIRELNIKVSNPENAVRTLSGGNQQRVVLAKWIATQPKILLLDSPTVGVDIANKDGIYEVVKALAARGVSVLMISDEIPEVLYHCHRVLVMRRGRIVGEFEPHETTEADLRQAVNG
jgi:simple sugar transport system ATP-binding protein